MVPGSLASQTLYLPAGGRKGSGNRVYNVSFPFPRIVGNNTLVCITYGVKFVYIPFKLSFRPRVVTKTAHLLGTRSKRR